MADEATVHELGHELRDVIAATVDAFVAFHQAQGVRVSSAAILLALEMEASVTRRLCREAGVTKDQIKEMQAAASDCAKSIFEAMDDEDNEPVHDVKIVGPLDN